LNAQIFAPVDFIKMLAHAPIAQVYVLIAQQAHPAPIAWLDMLNQAQLASLPAPSANISTLESAQIAKMPIAKLALGLEQANVWNAKIHFF